MANYNKNKKRGFKKKFSLIERKTYHADIMRKGFRHGGKLNKKESYSAGFIHWDSSSDTYNSVKKDCDIESFKKGEDAGSKAYRKAVNYKF